MCMYIYIYIYIYVCVCVCVCVSVCLSVYDSNSSSIVNFLLPTPVTSNSAITTNSLHMEAKNNINKKKVERLTKILSSINSI